MMRSLTRLFVCYLVCIAASMLGDPPVAVGDDAPSRPTKVEGGEAASVFQSHLEQWKDTISGLRALRNEYRDATDTAQREALEAEFDQLLNRGRALLPILRETGIAAYKDAPNDDPELTRFLFKVAKDDLVRDRYNQAWELGELLVKNDCGFPEIYNVAGVAAFVRNDYDSARKNLSLAKDRGVISPTGRNFLEQIDDCQSLWQEEQKLRELQAGKLPLVKLATTKGDITIELFENEAPQTVGNFIHLVKDKQFYDGLAFHEVVGGQRAASGCPNGDGTGDPGYKIYCECYKEGHRKHFRGSVSMETEGTRDTGGSRFFISFTPAPRLNGSYTVFGRVVDGMDVLAKLERTTPSSPADQPDKIVKATVLKMDEDKKYLPVKVKQ